MLCDSMDCSSPGFPVLHYLSEFDQTHVHQVSDAIQALSPSPPAFTLSQYQGLFQWVSSLHQVAKILETQHQCACVYVCVAQWCLTLCHPMDCSSPGSTVHGILQARIFEWVATTFSRRSSQHRDQTRLSHIAADSLPSEPPGKPQHQSLQWTVKADFL